MKKCFLYFVLLLFVFSLSSCKSNSIEPSSHASSYEPSVESQNYFESDEDTDDWAEFADFQSIIEEYQRVATYAVEFEYNGEAEEDLWYNQRGLGPIIAANIIGFSDLAKKDFGYALKDLDSDGNIELIFLLKENFMAKEYVMAIFSTENGKLKLVDEFWAERNCVFLESGQLYIYISGGGNSSFSIAEIHDGKLQTIEKCGQYRDTYWIYENSEEKAISKEEYYKLIGGYSDKYNSAKENNSYLEFIPLFEG